MTLIAQPREKKPLVSIAALQRGEYVVRRKGTFGVLWFTDIGAAVWETCLQTDGEARIKLSDHGFDELNWTIYFKTGGFQVRLESVLYKGKIGKVTNTFCILKVRHEDKVQVRTFVTKFQKLLGHYPFGFRFPSELENTTDKTPAMIIEDWESILGHKIDRAEQAPKARKDDKARKGAKKDKPQKPTKERRFGFSAGLGGIMAKAGMGAEEEAESPAEAETEPEPQVLECPECSAEVPLPTEGNILKCPECGLEGEAPERLEPVVFECPACDRDIEIWTQAMPEVLECPHCGVSGSLGEETEEEAEEAGTDDVGKTEVDQPAANDEPGDGDPSEVILKSTDNRGDMTETGEAKTEPLVRPGTTKAKAIPAAKKAARSVIKPKAKSKAKPKERPKEAKAPTGPKGKKLDTHPKLNGFWILDKYYIITDKGVKYDRELMEMAISFVNSRSSKQITVDDCEELYAKVADASKYTDTEKRTMKYIRDNYKFTPAGDKKFRHMIASWAAKRGAETRKAKEAKK